METERGVTLVELVLVLVILAIIISLALPRYLAVRKKAYLSEAYTMLQEIRGLEMGYFMEHIGCFQPNLATIGYVAPAGANWAVTSTGPNAEGGNGGPCDQNVSGLGFKGGVKGQGSALGQVFVTLGGLRPPLGPNDQVTLTLHTDGSATVDETL